MRIGWLEQDLLLLFIGSFVVWLNLHLAFIVMPLYVLELGGSEWMAVWYNALLAGSAVIVRLLLASWVDRYGRRFSLLLSGLALVIAPLLFLLSDSLVLLVLVRLIQGFGLALYPLATNTLIADLSPDGRRGMTIGLLRLINISALISGPPVAGLIIIQQGFPNFFWLLGIIGVVGMAPLLVIREPPTHSQGGAPLWSNIRIVFSLQPLPALFSSTAVCGLAFGIILTFVPLYAIKVGIENFGLFFTLFAFSGLVAAVVAGRLSDALGRKVVLVPALVLFGLGMVYLRFLMPGAAMIVSAALTGVGYSASLTLLVAWVIDVAGKELRAISLTLFENGIDVGITLGSFGFGTVIVLAGFQTAFTFTGLLILLSAFILFTVNQRVVTQN